MATRTVPQVDQEELLKQAAYSIWEREGRPDGKDKEHWERARRELSDRQLRKASPVAKRSADHDRPRARNGKSPGLHSHVQA